MLHLNHERQADSSLTPNEDQNQNSFLIESSVIFPIIEFCADLADKINVFWKSVEPLPNNKNSKEKIGFPQQEGPQAVMNNLSVMEIILFITSDWEEHTQLCKRVVETEMLVHRNQF